MLRDNHDGIYGASDAPSVCPDCGMPWEVGERVLTKDEAAIGGWEDWMYCKECDQELFYPVIHRPSCTA